MLCFSNYGGEKDFVNERSLPGIEITARGHECILYPRSHCELNNIKFFWGVVKRYIRENCSYSFVLEDTVLARDWGGLDSVSLITIRRFANRSGRWTGAYIDGLIWVKVSFDMCVYRRLISQ